MSSAPLLWGAGFLAVVLFSASVLPFFQAPHGAFRVLDFPRTQIAVLSAILILAIIFLLPGPGGTVWIVGLLIATILLQIARIVRFSPVWRRRSADFDGNPDSVGTVRLLVCNVQQGNRQFSSVIELVNQHDPDIAVFVETDLKWIDALREGISDYPFQLEQPLDNTYGMYLISRLRLYDETVRFLLNKEVPSFDVMVDKGASGSFRLITVHPEPPLPQNDTIARDAEIAFVGRLVRHDEHPVIVTGDLNDVAWSRTTRRFLRISRLLDPREGRGQFNSFHARYFFLRWPLDHLFHSPHFQLIGMKRLPFVGSDHFPMLYDLALTNEEKGRRGVDDADPADHEEAAELIDTEKRRDNRPVGHDWEED